MTASFRYGTGTSPFVGSESTNGLKDYSLIAFTINIGAIVANTATALLNYTGAGTIKSIHTAQVFTAAGVIRSTVNPDTFVLDATGKIITYTPQTANTAAGYVNLLLVIGNY